MHHISRNLRSKEDTMDNGERPPEDQANGPVKPNDAQGRPQVHEVFGDMTVGGELNGFLIHGLS